MNITTKELEYFAETWRLEYTRYYISELFKSEPTKIYRFGSHFCAFQLPVKQENIVVPPIGVPGISITSDETKLVLAILYDCFKPGVAEKILKMSVFPEYHNSLFCRSFDDVDQYPYEYGNTTKFPIIGEMQDVTMFDGYMDIMLMQRCTQCHKLMVRREEGDWVCTNCGAYSGKDYLGHADVNPNHCAFHALYKVWNVLHKNPSLGLPYHAIMRGREYCHPIVVCNAINQTIDKLKKYTTIKLDTDVAQRIDFSNLQVMALPPFNEFRIQCNYGNGLVRDFVFTKGTVIDDLGEEVFLFSHPFMPCVLADRSVKVKRYIRSLNDKWRHPANGEWYIDVKVMVLFSPRASGGYNINIEPHFFQIYQKVGNHYRDVEIPPEILCNVQEEFKSLQPSMQLPINALVQLCNLNACVNVKFVKPSQTHKPRTGDPAGIDYRIVAIESKGRYIPMTDILQDSATKGKMPLHVCRGHIKHYTAERSIKRKFVGNVWCPPHMRGNAKNGIVRKHYIAKGEKNVDSDTTQADN